MKQTSNYGLKKPEGQDVVNIEDLNYNADILDTQLKSLSNNKVDKVAGKQLSTEDYSAAEKQKLRDMESGANKYIHPSTHPGNIITEDSTHRWATDGEKANWNTVSNKIDRVSGKQLSTEDYTTGEKNKLSGIAVGANNYVHPTTHTASMITGLPTSLPANGGNADSIGGKKASDFAEKSHTHTIAQITDFKDPTGDLSSKISSLEEKIASMQNSIWIA